MYERCYQCRAAAVQPEPELIRQPRVRAASLHARVRAGAVGESLQPARQPVALSAPTQSHLAPARHRFTGSASTVCPSILAMHATALNYYVERSDYESYGSLGNGDSESEASPGCISSASSRAGTPPPPPASESTDAAFLGKVRYATSHPTI